MGESVSVCVAALIDSVTVCCVCVGEWLKVWECMGVIVGVKV